MFNIFAIFFADFFGTGYGYAIYRIFSKHRLLISQKIGKERSILLTILVQIVYEKSCQKW